jgi:hypothetical protein
MQQKHINEAKRVWIAAYAAALSTQDGTSIAGPVAADRAGNAAALAVAHYTAWASMAPEADDSKLEALEQSAERRRQSAERFLQRPR